jgi:prepilin-type N-terminal cleavage/methylation domain-containing protein
MKKKVDKIICSQRNGFTLLEMLISLTVIGFAASFLIYAQQSTWKMSGNSNKLSTAAQIIEKQIENRRMVIARDPVNNYARFKALSDTTIIDNSVTPSVKVVWHISAKTDVNGSNIENVRKVILNASWGYNNGDSLTVETCIGKNF